MVKRMRPLSRWFLAGILWSACYADIQAASNCVRDNKNKQWVPQKPSMPKAISLQKTFFNTLEKHAPSTPWFENFNFVFPVLPFIPSRSLYYEGIVMPLFAPEHFPEDKLKHFINAMKTSSYDFSVDQTQKDVDIFLLKILAFLQSDLEKNPSEKNFMEDLLRYKLKTINPNELVWGHDGGRDSLNLTRFRLNDKNIQDLFVAANKLVADGTILASENIGSDSGYFLLRPVYVDDLMQREGALPHAEKCQDTNDCGKKILPFPQTQYILGKSLLEIFSRYLQWPSYLIPPDLASEASDTISKTSLWDGVKRAHDLVPFASKTTLPKAAQIMFPDCRSEEAKKALKDYAHHPFFSTFEKALNPLLDPQSAPLWPTDQERDAYLKTHTSFQLPFDPILHKEWIQLTHDELLKVQKVVGAILSDAQFYCANLAPEDFMTQSIQFLWDTLSNTPKFFQNWIIENFLENFPTEEFSFETDGFPVPVSSLNNSCSFRKESYRQVSWRLTSLWKNLKKLDKRMSLGEADKESGRSNNIKELLSFFEKLKAFLEKAYIQRCIRLSAQNPETLSDPKKHEDLHPQKKILRQQLENLFCAWVREWIAKDSTIPKNPRFHRLSNVTFHSYSDKIQEKIKKYLPDNELSNSKNLKAADLFHFVQGQLDINCVKAKFPSKVPDTYETNAFDAFENFMRSYLEINPQGSSETPEILYNNYYEQVPNEAAIVCLRDFVQMLENWNKVPSGTHS